MFMIESSDSETCARLSTLRRSLQGHFSNRPASSRSAESHAIRQVLPLIALGAALLASSAQAQASAGTSLGCATNPTVTNANDSGAGSLRQAVIDVCADGEIEFSDRFEIQLASQIEVSKRFRISGSDVANSAGGPDHALLQIRGGEGHRIFQVNSGGELVLHRLRLSNGVLSGSDVGGAINHVGSGRLTLTECRVDGNRSGSATVFGGGAIFIGDSASLFVDASTFDNNVSHRGAAIFNMGHAELHNSTFSGNSSDNNAEVSEGTIQNRGALTAVHITVTNNDSRSTSDVGGLFTFEADTTLINSIFSGNDGRDCVVSGGVFLSVALLRGTGNCSSTLSGNPQLGAITDNGGLTATHALGAESAAQEVADPDFCLAIDQRGVPRTASASCDLGAFESPTLFANGFE